LAGTFSDPITFAAAKDALPPGTIIYVFKFGKYFIMEDFCQVLRFTFVLLTGTRTQASTVS
jgi:hypothetical protein